MKKDIKTYNLDLKDINPELAKRVSQHNELNRLIASAGKFFTSAMEFSEKTDLSNAKRKAMVNANFKWAMEQIDMAKILIIGKLSK